MKNLKIFFYLALFLLIITPLMAFSCFALNTSKSNFGNYNSQAGYIEESNTNFTTLINDGSATYSHSVYRSFVNIGYTIQRGYFFFNTSSLPDTCVISSVNMFFYVEYREGSITYTYLQRAECGDSLTNDDLNRTKFSYNVSKFIIAPAYKSYNISFTSNITTSINKTGVSCFVIRSANDYSGVYVAENFWEGGNFSTLNLYVSYYNPPVLTNPIPINNSISSMLNPKLSINANEINNNTMDIYFRTNSTGVWSTIGSNITVNNGTYTQQTTGMDIYSHKYYWSVNSTNSVLWENKTYSFITKGYLPMLVTSPYPSNNSIDITGTLSALHVLIRSGNGLPFNYSISLSNGDSYSYSNDDNGTKYLNLSFPLSYSYIYRWWVNVTDGINTTSYYYRFRIEIAPCTCIRFDINQLSLLVLGCLMAFFTLLGYLINNAKTGAAFLMFAGIFSILEMISVVAYFGGIWYLSSPGFIVVSVIFFKDMLLMIIYGDNWRKGNKK